VSEAVTRHRSIEARNAHERATTVLAVPLSTTPPRLPTHIAPGPGETGLSEASTIQAENITTVRKTSLHQPKQRFRRLSESVIEKIARGVQMGDGISGSSVSVVLLVIRTEGRNLLLWALRVLRDPRWNRTRGRAAPQRPVKDSRSTWLSPVSTQTGFWNRASIKSHRKGSTW